ncbi:FAD-dependent oxidoreductase [Ensifer sp. ENS07]|uniref:NAD(P)/FAD-dependent oxidoreductase n=1 Tax=Ensifer sp. ENS07 TaxID=2769274 RepID=UPI00177DBDD9|nr:FAD-dependent oxidoreductase [Ensifer sp. ENS07]MBD9638981.1 FAD-dependent oxidoreductase [Ensifer sp. ENS07]
MTNHVIIGAGEAGLRAAATLRDAGESHVTLVGGEQMPSYDRPALSKPDGETGLFHRPIAVDLAGVEVMLGRTADRIDRVAKEVILTTGERLTYDRLLLATGARPRRLPCDPAGHALMLRTLADAEAIYGKAVAGARAVMIGAGLIGLELAAELTRRGMAVHVLEAGPRALGRGVPAEIADVIVGRHRYAGSTFDFDVRIDRFEQGSVVLADGNRIEADLLIAAVGVEPEVGLALSAGLTCPNGIEVDRRLVTSDPSILAAGDCAVVDHPRYGRTRFETWRNACDQGAHAAKVMLGGHESFDALPWFWSDHFDLGLQAVGLHDPSRRAVRRDLTEGGWLRFELDENDVLQAASGIGPGNSVARDIRLAEKLIERGASCSPEALADPGSGLKSLLKVAA